MSIVIPFFGDPAPTLALVDQLRVQQDVALEIIVADDASPRPFPEMDGVIVVRRAVNGGFGAAVNTGVGAAHGDYLLVLNSDIEIAPGFVGSMLDAAAPYQPCVAGPVLLEGADGHPGPTARDFPRVRHYAIEWCSALVRAQQSEWWRRLHGHDLRAVPGRVVRTDWVVGAVMLVPRTSYLSVGGMDENFFMNCEEVDLQERLAREGVPAVYLGTVECRHALGGSSDPAKRSQWVLDARFYLMEKERGRRGRLEMAGALYAVSGVNFLTNCLRRSYNRDVRPRAIFSQEVARINGHAGRRALVPARLPR